jgi:hypothetical protein
MKAACTPDVDVTIAEPNGRGKAFTDAIPDAVAAMQNAACVACSMLYRTPDEIPQQFRHQTLKLFIEGDAGVAYAIPEAGEIHFDHQYISDVAGRSSAEETLQEFTGVLAHETAHLYQNYGEFHTGEGMADWLRVRVGYYQPGRCGPGGDWMGGYTTTGCFFSWLTGPSAYLSKHHPDADLELGFDINKVLGDRGADGVPDLLMEKFGASVDELWDQYQQDVQ